MSRAPRRARLRRKPNAHEAKHRLPQRLDNNRAQRSKAQQDGRVASAAAHLAAPVGAAPEAVGRRAGYARVRVVVLGLGVRARVRRVGVRVRSGRPVTIAVASTAGPTAACASARAEVRRGSCRSRPAPQRNARLVARQRRLLLVAAQHNEHDGAREQARRVGGLA